MTRKLTSEAASALVFRIEALQGEIEKVYDEARTYDGANNDRVIADAVAARHSQREAGQSAAALLGSFDFDDDGQRLAAPARSAWQAMAARLREALEALPASKTRDYIAKQIAIIDKLEAFALDQGLPVITEEQFASLKHATAESTR